MRIRVVVSTVLLAFIAIGIVGGSARQDESGTPLASPEATGTVVLVEIEDFTFNPRRIEITVGDTVRWKNLDSSPHSVISDEDDEPVDSGRMDRGAGFRHQFDTPGSFNYECGYHQNMGGIVVVHPDDATPEPA